MYDSSHACPHCGADKRNINEIVESINDLEISNLKENTVDDFDSTNFIIALSAALKLGNIKSDPIKTAKIQTMKNLLEEYSSLHEDYESSENEDEESSRITLIETKKKINTELPELLSELSESFFGKI